MENKLYVGNLSYGTTEEDLNELFAQAGTVKSVAVIKDRDSGRSKGFGFVEMSSSAEAQKAITMYHGKELQGRTLTVNVARPREEQSRGGGGYDSRRSSSSSRGSSSGGSSKNSSRRSSW